MGIIVNSKHLKTKFIPHRTTHAVPELIQYRYDNKRGAMAGILDLKPGAPRAPGLRRRDYTLASLHGDHIQQPPKGKPPRPSPSINASPRGSSSDEDLAGQKVADDAASDDSEFGRVERMKKSGGDDIPRMGMDSSATKGELNLESSNIRASSFTSGKRDRSRHGSQSSQKRTKVDLDDDDDMPLSFSQRKKPRHSYGYGSINIHRSPATKPDKSKRMRSNEIEKGPSTFREPATRTGAMLARGRNFLCISNLRRLQLTSSS